MLKIDPRSFHTNLATRCFSTPASVPYSRYTARLCGMAIRRRRPPSPLALPPTNLGTRYGTISLIIFYNLIYGDSTKMGFLVRYLCWKHLEKKGKSIDFLASPQVIRAVTLSHSLVLSEEDLSFCRAWVLLHLGSSNQLIDVTCGLTLRLGCPDLSDTRQGVPSSSGGIPSPSCSLGDWNGH